MKSYSNFSDSYLCFMVAIIFLLDLSLTVLKIGLHFIFCKLILPFHKSLSTNIVLDSSHFMCCDKNVSIARGSPFLGLI